jgi:hypothetical protein
MIATPTNATPARRIRNVRSDGLVPVIGSQHPLHEHDVEPLAELPSDLALGADDLETQRFVQPDRGVVPSDDPGHDGVEAPGHRDGDDLGEKGPADPPTPEVVVDVDRVLDGGGVGGSNPAICPAISATTTAMAPDRSSSQTSWSSSDRGTRSKVTVDPVTSLL